MRPGDLMMRPLALYGWAALDPYLAALDNPEYPARQLPLAWRQPRRDHRADMTAGPGPQRADQLGQRLERLPSADGASHVER